MNILKKMHAVRDSLYCSRALQTLLPGGGRDKAGRKLLRAELWEDAEKHYVQALQSHPGRVLFLERAAIAKLKSGKFAEAEAIFAGLAADYPGVPRFAFHLAQILLGGERTTKPSPCLTGLFCTHPIL